jgi:VanZ family protein
MEMRPHLVLLLFDARYRKWKFRCAFLLYLAVLVLGSIPGARADIGELASGLVLHAATYSLITFLLFSGADGSTRSKAFKSFAIVAAMGALDEYVQSFFPYRSASVMDWMVDVSAGFIASCVLALVWPKDADRSPTEMAPDAIRLSNKFPKQRDG